ncbi:hypothetical protein D9M70_509400 [compost metagenome]
MLVAERRTAAVDEEDDRRFETLGGVHRHDPDFVAFLVLLALDRRRFHFERRNEGLQTGEAASFLIEGEGEELVKNVADLGAEPRQEGRPAAMNAKDAGIKIVRCKRVRERHIAFQRPCCLVEQDALGRLGLEPLPEAFAFFAPRRELEQRVFAEIEQRAFQQRGE